MYLLTSTHIVAVTALFVNTATDTKLFLLHQLYFLYLLLFAFLYSFNLHLYVEASICILSKAVFQTRRQDIRLKARKTMGNKPYKTLAVAIGNVVHAQSSPYSLFTTQYLNS